MHLLSFKDFIESYEKKPNYLTGIQDELGIDPESVEKTAGWASNVSLKNISFNGINYKINRIVKDSRGEVKGAFVSPLNVDSTTQRAYLKTKDGSLRNPNSSVSEKEIFLPIDKLNGLLTQGMQAPASNQSSLPGMQGMM